MSRFAVIPLYVLDRAELIACLPVLCVLGGYTDKNGWAFPSQKTIGSKLGISRQAVSKHLLALERAGVIQVVHQYREDGGQRSSRYRIIMDIPGEPEYSKDPEDAEGSEDYADYPTPATPVVAPPATPVVAPPATPVVAAERPNITTQCNVKRKHPREAPPALPEWLDQADWQAFLDHRKRHGPAMSPDAQRRAIAALGKLRADGNDPAAVIDQSIVNGWKGFFPLRRDTPRNNGRAPMPTDDFANKVYSSTPDDEMPDWMQP